MVSDLRNFWQGGKAYSRTSFLFFLKNFIYLFIYLFTFKDFIYLFLEGGEGREKERERNIDVQEIR